MQRSHIAPSISTTNLLTKYTQPFYFLIFLRFTVCSIKNTACSLTTLIVKILVIIPMMATGVCYATIVYTLCEKRKTSEYIYYSIQIINLWIVKIIISQ